MYLSRASCHEGNRLKPFSDNFSFDILEFEGRFAFAGYSALDTGLTFISIPAALNIATANSYQLMMPSFVA
jgi:hypothetical protein